MQDKEFIDVQIKSLLEEYVQNTSQCGLEAFIVTKNAPKLRRMSFAEQKNENGKDFRTILKEMFMEVIKEKFLSPDAVYADGHFLADNQHKYLIFEQGESFSPFSFLNEHERAVAFSEEDLEDAIGIVFYIRKGISSIWLYQHLWSIMMPNKKKTSKMTRMLRMEKGIEFSEMKERLLAIAKKVDILIIDNYLITSNISLLQKSFGFQDYIYQTAEQAIQSIAQTLIVTNVDKLTDYIRRGNSKYAKKMMRIGSSSVFSLSKGELIMKINSIPRWQGKFDVNPTEGTITLNTYKQVEFLIDLFDERYTRSEITNTEYDTDVKSVAEPVELGMSNPKW